MKIWWISWSISTIAFIIYVVATFRLNIPFYLNILVAIVLYALVFVVIVDLEIYKK